VSLFALIPAAGTGSRVAGDVPKQYLALAGRPMLWHAVNSLSAREIELIFVVLAPEDAQFGKQDWSAFDGRMQPLYCGGETRRDSVYNGLVAAHTAVNADDWVLVHDAARPCLPARDLASLIRETQPDQVGGILALPVAETVKKISRDDAGVERIAGTEDRSQLWLAQTPQMFRAGLLAQALRQAKGRVTDEASAVEQLGLRPRVVAGSRENLKVTWPEDVAIAESILLGKA
jgi:2-C-methyl-D-erythritol 4-phosphate cytidylyltransferase